LIVRRCGHQLMNGLRIRPTLTLLERGWSGSRVTSMIR
jgi:hypothetical protein